MSVNSERDDPGPPVTRNCGGLEHPDGTQHGACACRAERLRRDGVDTAFDYIVDSLRHKAEEHRAIAVAARSASLVAAHFKVAMVLDDAADGYEDGLRPPVDHLRGENEGTDDGTTWPTVDDSPDCTATEHVGNCRHAERGECRPEHHMMYVRPSPDGSIVCVFCGKLRGESEGG